MKSYKRKYVRPVKTHADLTFVTRPQKHWSPADIPDMPHFRSPMTHVRKGMGGAGGTGGSTGTADGAKSAARATVEAHFAAVCAVLWSERELLESLACTVIVEQLMSHAGAARQAADDVQHDAMHRLGLQEVLRGAIVDALLTAITAPPTTTLRQLAAIAPEPWATMLREHRESLTALSTDLESLAGFEQLSLPEFLG